MAVSAPREWRGDGPGTGPQPLFLPLLFVLFWPSLVSCFCFPTSPHPPLGPGHWMGSQCTLFICSLFSRQRNFYKIRDTNSNKLTFTSLRVFTTGQHSLVRKMFLFLVLSNFVVSLS